MGARKKIALIYDYSEGWIAGSYYVANVLKAVNELPDKEKVHFVILNQSGTGWDLLKEIHYPYIDLVGVHEGGGFFPNLIRRLSKKLLGRDYYLRYKLKDVKDILNGWNYFSFIPRHFFWVHDFQEFRMPQFFSPEEAAQRSALPKAVAKMPDATLILSSRDALNDFSTFFPNHKCKTRIVQFASALPDTSGINFETERTKYNIKTPYFICSNQFWQ